MKRSTILVFVTFAVLVLLFSAYLFFAPQPSVIHEGNTLTPAVRTTTTPTGSMGTGEGAWVKQFDVHTGALSSQFRGTQYERQSDDTIKVIRPEAEFYLSDGQILRINGNTGVVTVAESLRPGREQVFSGPSKPPTRGDLKDVHIRLFKDALATTPTLTCVMDNATFDNETFRIFTRDAVIGGVSVAADQIPVKLRGVDYDFDGRGLTIRLNQLDRRLEYLQVAHGQKLIIKNPSKLNDSLAPTTQAALNTPLPFMLAETSDDGLPPLIRPPASTKKAADRVVATRPAGPAIYRAIFQDNVRVNQSDQDIATGDELQVDFLFDDASPSGNTRKSRNNKAVTQETTPTNQATAKSDAPRATTMASAHSPASAPTTRTAQPPITIYWTGPLMLAPTPASDEAPTGKNSIVRINGSPLHVRQGSSTIVGAALVYRTATQHLSLRGTDAFPLTLNDGKGAIVHGTTIDYLQQERIATLDGPGNAVKTLPSDNPGEQPKELASSWSRSAILFFTGQPNEPLRIETAKLAGNVSVQHPQLQLTSELLKLDFDPSPATRPATTSPANLHEKNSPPDFTASDLRHLDAQGNVHATVISANSRPQSIDADHLALDTASTPDGRIYPKTLIADGSVRAFDPEQELRAQHLKSSLLPVSQPVAAKGPATKRKTSTSASVPVELEHLTAINSVTVKTADGVKASADRLDVDIDPATHQQHVRLLGEPAHVANKDNAVTGPYIEIIPADQVYHVRGPGQMHLIQRETPQSKPRPIDVAWKDSVAVDGKKNVIDVLGSVTVLSTDENGAQNTVSGEHLVITLADNPNPSTKASTRKTSTTKAASITGIASAGDPMQNKIVQTITFAQGANVQSIQTDRQTSDLQRQMNLIADVLTYDLPHKRVTVPVPGKMLVVNHAASADAANATSSRGTTAFAWDQRMVFDQIANIMVMTGNVAIVHESESGNDKPFRLDADKVTATLTPKAPTTRQATGQPSDAMELKHVLAEGTIRFTSKDMQLTAATVDYDPTSGLLIARGLGRDPVHLYDIDGVLTGTADEIWYNAKTGENLKAINLQAQTRRR